MYRVTKYQITVCLPIVEKIVILVQQLLSPLWDVTSNKKYFIF